MTYRRLVGLILALALGGALVATILLDPLGANAILDEQIPHAEKTPLAGGTWEFYADPEAVRRESMARQAKVVAGPVIDAARSRLQTWLTVVMPLGVIALVAALALVPRIAALSAAAAPPPTRPPRNRRTPRRAGRAVSSGGAPPGAPRRAWESPPSAP